MNKKNMTRAHRFSWHPNDIKITKGKKGKPRLHPVISEAALANAVDALNRATKALEAES